MSIKLMRDVRQFSTEKYEQELYELHVAMAAMSDDEGYFECSPVDLADLLNRNAKDVALGISQLEYRSCLTQGEEKYYGDEDSELWVPYDESCRYQLTVPIPRITGCVYAIKFDEYYKIGRTQHLNDRIPQLAIQLPKKPYLIHCVYSDNPLKSEKLFHQWWDDIRLNGEWFDLTPSHLEFFRSAKEALCDGRVLWDEHHWILGSWELFLKHKSAS